MGVESMQWFFATHTQTTLNVLKLQWPVIVVIVVVTASCGLLPLIPRTSSARGTSEVETVQCKAVALV